MAWSHSLASLRWFASMSSWLSQGWPGAVPDLHEAHAALDQPPGDQHCRACSRPAPYMSSDRAAARG